MDNRQRRELDRHITGNYGEDQFRQERESDVDDAGNAVHTRSKMTPDDGALAQPSATPTPGPWTLESADGVHYISASPNSIAICNESDGSSEANARLIAAAPDLLAALERIIEQTKDGEDGWNTLNTYPRLNDICDTARTAIEKARA